MFCILLFSSLLDNLMLKILTLLSITGKMYESSGIFQGLIFKTH